MFSCRCDCNEGRLAMEAAKPAGEVLDVVGRERFNLEIRLGLGKEIRRFEILQAVYHAMGGQDNQTLRVHIDEGHHDGGLRVGRLGQGIRTPLGVRCGRRRLVLTGVIEGRLISVMAVRDDKLLILEAVVSRLMVLGSLTRQTRCRTSYSSVT